MILYIYDTNHNLISIRENDEVVWSESFKGVGDFEIKTPMDSESIKTFKVDHIIVRADKNRQAGVIESIETSISNENTPQMLIKGRMLASIFDRRILPTKSSTYYTMTQEWVSQLTIIVWMTMGQSASAKRQITGLCPAFATEGDLTFSDSTEPKDIQPGSTVLDAFQSILAPEDIGYKVVYKPENAGKTATSFTDSVYTITLYNGQNRTSTSSNPIIFSKENNNLLSLSLHTNKAPYKTTAYMCVQDTTSPAPIWADRVKTSSINNTSTHKEDYTSAKDLQRREVFVQIGKDTLSGTTDRAVYNTGKNALYSYPVTTAIQAEVDTADLTYGVDFTLGDTITVKDDDMGISANMQIVEVTESDTATGYSCDITLA